MTASSRRRTPIRTRSSESRRGSSGRPGASSSGSPMDSRRQLRPLAPPPPPACAAPATRPPAPDNDRALLDDVEHRTFDFFWTTADPRTSLVPDRHPTPSFSSIAAVGFGLTAYAIGAERG